MVKAIKYRVYFHSLKNFQNFFCIFSGFTSIKDQKIIFDFFPFFHRGKKLKS